MQTHFDHDHYIRFPSGPFLEGKLINGTLGSADKSGANLIDLYNSEGIP